VSTEELHRWRARDLAVGSLHRLQIRTAREGDGPPDDLDDAERERLRVAYRSELERWEDGEDLAMFGPTDDLEDEEHDSTEDDDDPLRLALDDLRREREERAAALREVFRREAARLEAELGDDHG
jgi:hypothetical protein